ncbi:integral membrane protein [Streptomyces zinciresistens K42]|uniref:Integral membrane protein n=1 Tax=Streptomyces zinciresistens K42 TaxID=700597 RepID=G2G682_9ACTN|nr:type II secretion system F family protein [Streptomyces zinciresistens]EGX60953.1 integral membrane protein [Streptomyces zinciresistens K42]
MSGEVFHRLGTVAVVTLLVGWLLRWATTVRQERRTRRRLTGLLAIGDVTRARQRVEVLRAARRWTPVVAVVAAGWALVGGVAGLVVGCAAGSGLCLWSRRRTVEAASAEPDADEVTGQLPLAADLLAACIAAGAGPVVAAQAVGEALGGPVGDALARGAAEVRLGSEPGAAWQRLASMPKARGLARLLERADVSGLPAASPVARLAADARADWGRAATERARRAAVMVTAPVGLCFLPAFIAIGVAPVVIGLAGGALGGGGR